MTEHLYLHVSLDDFYAMLPNWFRQSRSEQWPTVNLNMQKALFKTADALAKQGNYVVVDTVLPSQQDLQACVHSLHSRYALFVGLYCSLEEVERREQGRDDRVPGLARWQFPLVHTHDIYDLELDTLRQTPKECALTIQERLEHSSKPTALAQLHKSL